MTKRATDASILAREEQTMAKCVEFIRANPGLEAAHLPRHFRYVLRQLEQRGKIECRGFQWFAK